MQARLVKRERSYMVGISVSIPRSTNQTIKLNKTVMKRLVSLQRYLTIQGTEEIIALCPVSPLTSLNQEWIIGYHVPHRFPVNKEFSLHEIPGGTYFVGTRGTKLETIYDTMQNHWIMTEMYDQLPTLFERYTIAGDNKRIEVYSRVRPKISEHQHYA